jgi:hypothetical protein
VPLKPGDVRRKLKSKFKFKDCGGTNHDRFKLWIDNVLVSYVDIDRTTDDLGDDLVKFMAHQAGVRPRQFREMIQCTISRAQYESYLLAPVAPSDGHRTVGPGTESP